MRTGKPPKRRHRPHQTPRLAALHQNQLSAPHRLPRGVAREGRADGAGAEALTEADEAVGEASQVPKRHPKKQIGLFMSAFNRGRSSIIEYMFWSCQWGMVLDHLQRCQIHHCVAFGGCVAVTFLLLSTSRCSRDDTSGTAKKWPGVVPGASIDRHIWQSHGVSGDIERLWLWEPCAALLAWSKQIYKFPTKTPHLDDPPPWPRATTKPSTVLLLKLPWKERFCGSSLDSSAMAWESLDSFRLTHKLNKRSQGVFSYGLTEKTCIPYRTLYFICTIPEMKWSIFSV